VYNLGTGKEISIGDLAQKIIELIGTQVSIITDNQRLRPEKSEVERLLSDPSKTFRVTGWKSAYTLEEGLRETISWIEKNIDVFKTDLYNV
jgi:nucleoside-diphosphate-sugar epimerase